MDWGSVAGLVIALLGILVGQAIEGGQLGSLIQPAAFLIVVFGTIGAVLLQSGVPNFARAMRMAKQVFSPIGENDASLRREIVGWSTTARREGMLSLERFITQQKDPFIQKGLQLLVDGVDPHKLEDILNNDISTYEREERLAVRVWEAAGGYAPTVGILGAVLGLIHVMENLSDPSKLGGGIAVAFVATIYGVGLANLVFLPIGSKLKAMVTKEVTRRERLTEAFAGIAMGDNPRLIEERIASEIN